jgi:hypothetical protein
VQLQYGSQQIGLARKRCDRHPKMNLHKSHGVSMMPNLHDFLPFFDEFFPLLNMFANEAASEGFSATISATFMIPARVSIQPTTIRSSTFNLGINLWSFALPQSRAGPWIRARLYYSHRTETVPHGEQRRNSWVLIVFTENVKSATTITLLSI